MALTAHEIEALFIAPLPLQETSGLGPYWLVPNTSRMVTVGEALSPSKGPTRNTCSSCLKDGPIVRDPAFESEVQAWDELPSDEARADLDNCPIRWSNALRTGERLAQNTMDVIESLPSEPSMRNPMIQEVLSAIASPVVPSQ